MPNFEHEFVALAGQRILVTGATGFIGSRLALRLHELGSHVIGYCRNLDKGAWLAEKGITLKSGDITDTARLENLVGEGIDVVIHLAAWMRGSSAIDAARVNVDATRHLAMICASHNVKRFIYTSSIAVYGLHGDRDVDETTPLALYDDPYGDSKILAESALHEVGRETGLSYTIVRPGMVYGPGSPGWTKRLALWAKKGLLPLVDGGTGAAYPIFIDNLIDLMLLCILRDEAHLQTFNAVDEAAVPLSEFLGAYMRMIPTTRAIRLPGWLFSAVCAIANPFSRGLNLNYLATQMRGKGCILNHKAKVMLGWNPRIEMDEGMRQAEQWLRTEGIL